MARHLRLICPSEALQEGGKGVRFCLQAPSGSVAAFAVRYGGTAFAYVNSCAHLGVELDWLPGEFFDASGLYLICATHGATFEPQTGYCNGGPCKGRTLQPVPVTERDGAVFIVEGSLTHDRTDEPR